MALIIRQGEVYGLRAFVGNENTAGNNVRLPLLEGNHGRSHIDKIHLEGPADGMREPAQDVGVHPDPCAPVGDKTDRRYVAAADAFKGSRAWRNLVVRLFRKGRPLGPVGDNLFEGGRYNEAVKLGTELIHTFAQGKGHFEVFLALEGPLQVKPFQLGLGKGDFVGHEDIGLSLLKRLHAVCLRIGGKNADVLTGTIHVVVVAATGESDSKAREIFLGLNFYDAVF